MSYVLSLPILRPDQWTIASHPAKRKKLCMGRRWGKSVLGGALAIAVANQGGHCGWGAPNYKQTRPLWRWIERICKPLENAGVQISQAERIVEFPSGGFLGLYSLDNPDSIRSEAFHLFIVDEAAKVSDAEALDDALEPTLADYDGMRYDISSPRGKNHFYTEYNLALSDLSGFSAAWHAPSSANPSPNIRKAVLLAEQRVKEGRLTERSYRQEWLAEFVEGGTFFQNVRECAILQIADPADHIKHRKIIGGDFAQQEDYTWLTALCIDCHCMLDMERFNQISWTIQLERVVNFCKKWGTWDKLDGKDIWVNAPIMPERNSIGSPLVEQMQTAGLVVLVGHDDKPGFYTNAQTKQLIVKSLFTQLATKELKIINNPILISELESFEEKPTAYGATYSAPAGLHDDGVMSLAIGNYALDRFAHIWYSATL